MRLRSYQDLVGWQKSMALVTEVYRYTKDFPPNEIYGVDQPTSSRRGLDPKQYC